MQGMTVPSDSQNKSSSEEPGSPDEKEENKKKGKGQYFEVPPKEEWDKMRFRQRVEHKKAFRKALPRGSDASSTDCDTCSPGHFAWEAPGASIA